MPNRCQACADERFRGGSRLTTTMCSFGNWSSSRRPDPHLQENTHPFYCCSSGNWTLVPLHSQHSSPEVQSESNKNLMMGESYKQTCSMRSNFLKIWSWNIAKLLVEVEDQTLSQAMVCTKGSQYRQGEDAASPWNTPQRWVPGNTWSLRLERRGRRRDRKVASR